MLQKIVNGIAIASGVVSITVVGVAGYVYIRKDAIIDNVKGKIIESALPKGLGEALTSGGMPTLPTTPSESSASPLPLPISSPF